MKQTIITLLLLIAATVANAQNSDEPNFSKRLFEAKLAEVSLRLNLTDEQKSKFAPIYEQYCNEMNELIGRPHNGRPMMRRPGAPGMRPDGPGAKRGNKDKKDKSDKADKKNKADRQRPEKSDADKVKHMKERMEKQKKAQEIRLNYSDKFAIVLTDKQLLEFYDVEDDIQRKLHERAKKANKKD